MDTQHKVVSAKIGNEEKDLSQDPVTGELDIGGLYEMNKEIFKQTHPNPLSNSALREKEKLIMVWFANKVKEFAMLYNKEKSDFTIFQLKYEATVNSRTESFTLASQQVVDVLQERGEIISIEKQEDGAFEIWIKDQDDYFVYYLFNYDNAVIKCEKNWLQERGWLRK